MKIQGGCHCGKIVYKAEIDPKNVWLCHCTELPEAELPKVLSFSLVVSASPVLNFHTAIVRNYRRWRPDDQRVTERTKSICSTWFW